MNPFDDDIFAEGISSAGGIHEDVLEALAATARDLEKLGSEDATSRVRSYGRTALLLAPRAGYGKSHLLSRLAERLQEATLFVPLNFEPELPTTWTRLSANLASLLQARPFPQDSNLTLMDEVARFYFSQLVIMGMQSGHVEADSPQQAMEYVFSNYRELFDSEAGDQSRAEWFQEAYEPLMEALSEEVAATFAIDEEAAKFWGQTFYKYTYPKNKSAKARSNGVMWALGIADENIAEPDQEHHYKKKFCDLAQIASAASPVVFVVDHLDGFHGDVNAGMRIAHVLSEIAGSVPRSMTVISTNQEVWASLFAQQLPTALEDRLTWDKRQLESLAIDEADRLIRHRLAIANVTPHETTAFVESLNLSAVAANARENSFTPRTLIRYARRMWERFDRQGVVSDPEAEAKTVPFPTNGQSEPLPPLPMPPPPAIKPLEPPQKTPAAAETPVAQASPEETRERLKAVAEAIRQQSRPPKQPSEVEKLVDTGATATLPTKELVPGSLPGVFQDYRLKHLGGTGPEIDPAQLKELVEAVGDHFPAVRQDDEDPTADANGTCVIWHAQGREIYLGFAEQTNYRFWQEMIGAGQKRIKELDEDPRLKLVVFSPKSEPFPMARLFTSRDQAQEMSPLVDRVELDSELLASLYAAADMIRDQRSGKLPFKSAQIFGFVATELDYFWRRLTRIGEATGAVAVKGA